MTTSRGRLTPLLDRVDAMSVAATVVLAAVLGLVVVVSDVLTGGEISFSIFYVAPIAIVAWRLGRTAGFAASAIAAGAWFLGELISDRDYSQTLIPLWNGLVRLGFFAIIAQLLVALRDLLREQSRNSRLDSLTGLLNRRGFVERAEVELARAGRSKRPITVVYFDLDRFKRLNDSAGHAAGDELLRSIGTSMTSLLRQVDLIGRMGGDEFAVLLPEAGAAEARTIVERLRGGLGSVAGRRGVGLSIGVVTFDPAPVDIDAALQRADRLMYVAKSEERGTVRFETERTAASGRSTAIGSD